MRPVLLLPFVALVLVGCRSGGGALDGGALPDGGLGIVEPQPPALPEAPAPPDLGPCPPGWRALDGACEPWPATGRGTCDPGEMHLPGAPGCARVGAPCPAGNFAANLPALGVVYVLAGAAGGDGSASAPFGTIGQGVAAVSIGGVVAVGKGSYSETVTVPAGVTLQGACASASVVSSDLFDRDSGVIRIDQIGVVLRDLGIGTSRRPGVSVHSSGTVRLEGVVLSGTMSRGILVTNGADLVTEDVLITGARSRETDGASGVGLLVQAGPLAGALPGTATLRRTTLSGNQGAGIAVFDPGSSLVLEDCVLYGTLPLTVNGGGGNGLSVASGATATVRRSVFEDNLYIAVGGFVGASIEIEDSVIRDTAPGASGAFAGQFGRGVYAEGGSSIVVRRSLIAANHERGVLAAASGSRVEIFDSIIRDTRSEVAAGLPGHGLAAQSGGTVLATRTLIEGSRGIGVTSLGAQASVVLTDVTVRDTSGTQSDGSFGYGASAQEGGALELLRVVFERNRDVGLSVAGLGTSVTGSDVVVRDMLSEERTLLRGRGVEVSAGATLVLDRVLVEKTRDVAILVEAGDSQVVFEDLTVRGTLPQESDSTFGRGISLQGGSRGRIVRAVIEDSRVSGILIEASLEPATWVLEDIVVRDIDSELSTGLQGGGIIVQSGASVTLIRGVVERTRTGGVIVVDRAFLDATDLVVRDIESQVSDQRFGRGLELHSGSIAIVDGLLIERATDIGIVVGQTGTSLDLSRFIVRDTAPRDQDRRYGRGMSVEAGAEALVRQGVFEGNREVSVAALLRASIRLEDVDVIGTLPRACVVDTCTGAGAGIGIGSYSASSIVATRFRVLDTAQCGVQLAADGEMDLSNGEVRDAVIGACVQVDGYDLDRLQNDVRYLDNETNLDSTSLPVPSASDPL